MPGLRVVAVAASLGADAALAAARLGRRGADAGYAATAHRLGAAQVTLDDELAERARGFVAVVRARDAARWGIGSLGQLALCRPMVP